jgi:hypothetical protein
MRNASRALLEAGFPSPGLAVAEVLGVDRGRLLWTPWAVPAKSKDERALQRLAIEFFGLPEAGDEAVLQLAREFGPLGLCEEHGAPMCHGFYGDIACAPSRREENPELALPPGKICPPKLEVGAVEGKHIYSEPTDRWRHWARHARSVLLLAEEGRRGELGSPNLWRDATIEFPKDLQDAVIKLAGALELWRKLAELQPTIAIGTDSQPAMRLWLVSASAQHPMGLDGRLEPATGFRGALFGSIALHLLLAASAGAGIAHCSNPECRRFYLPKKLPRADRANYCDVCQRNNAKQRLYDRRVNAAPRAHAEARKHSKAEAIPEIYPAGVPLSQALGTHKVGQKKAPKSKRS